MSSANVSQITNHTLSSPMPALTVTASDNYLNAVQILNLHPHFETSSENSVWEKLLKPAHF